MKELVYKIEFLSDVVLPATSNTEGNITQLDFIPGSNFLGMVASNYDKFEDSFKVFHSGTVRFGDATILKDDKQTFKMPLSYFHEKLNDKKIFNHHRIDDFSEFTQLKQKRNGYITKELELVEINYNYSQKSAYDKTNRRSKDSSMYGYSAIDSCTKWQFSIKYDDSISPNDLELIKNTIVGKKRLGKSKSAQYGLIKIEEIKSEALILSKEILKDEVILYANSRLALIDEEANPTYNLKYLCDGLCDENIVYEKTQIRTSTFSPYNGARETKDYERVCINKGSVIVLKEISDEQLKNIVSGVGAYLSDGFGELIANPDFLAQKSFEFKSNNEDEKSKIVLPIKNDVAKFLQQREDTKKARVDLAKDVSEFKAANKKLYEKIKNSQWGKIRSICTSSKEDFKDEIKKYINSGKVTWEDKQIKTLLDDKYTLEFIKLLAIQMPKVKPPEEPKND
ncbi:MAG: hypothetical protein L3I99_08100 [Sulfurimonas sp.]|nr:hypothetical protein [Sulfurimonas sp.]